MYSINATLLATSGQCFVGMKTIAFHFNDVLLIRKYMYIIYRREKYVLMCIVPKNPKSRT